MNAKSTIGLMLAAGTACVASAEVPVFEKEMVELKVAETHSIYVSASGERIQLADADTPTVRGAAQTRVWVNNRVDPCGFGDPDGADDIPGNEDDAADLTLFVLGFATPDGSNPFGFDPSTNLPSNVAMNWGDVPADSVVNAIGTWAWYDFDGNGTVAEGDPITGLDMTVGFVEGFNGAVPANNTPAVPFAFTIGDLGSIVVPVGYVAGFYFVVDLVADFGGVDQTFELGDSDGMGPASGNFVPNSFFDDPGDASSTTGGLGLHDFGYYKTFDFPDFGQTANDPGLSATMGSWGDVEYVDSQGDFFAFSEGAVNAFPTGLDFNAQALFNAGLDLTTALPVGLDPAGPEFLGLFAPAGDISPIDCASGSGALPPIPTWLELFLNEVDTPCLADFNGDNNINILDVVDFIAAWQMGLDYNGDMNVNILDVVDFIADWQAGCP